MHLRLLMLRPLSIHTIKPTRTIKRKAMRIEERQSTGALHNFLAGFTTSFKILFSRSMKFLELGIKSRTPVTNPRKIHTTKLWSEDAGNIISQRIKVRPAGGIRGALRALTVSETVKRGRGMGCGMGIGTIEGPDGFGKIFTGIPSGLPVNPLNKSRREIRLRIQGLNELFEESIEVKQGFGRMPGNTKNKLDKTGQRIKTVLAKTINGMVKILAPTGSGGEIILGEAHGDNIRKAEGIILGGGVGSKKTLERVGAGSALDGSGGSGLGRGLRMVFGDITGGTETKTAL
ncbi:hypothetical protein X943_003592 [Babesia divergens]|uniref:Uncharacterized protein n=1 Tax=Babesia divergens TaxID=32595 RepID=A0AAD9LET7_BABDI|nr:hypothetical protein X943_003592 [Babesia divergens]